MISIAYRFGQHLFILVTLALIFAALLPQVVHADSLLGNLVSCGNDVTVTADGSSYVTENECTICDLQILAQNLINWFVAFAVLLAALLFVNAGVLYITSPGNTANVAKGHQILTKTLIGLIVVLAAWLLIDVVMKTALPNSGQLKEASGGYYGPWNEVLCPSDPGAFAARGTTVVDVQPKIVVNPTTPNDRDMDALERYIEELDARQGSRGASGGAHTLGAYAWSDSNTLGARTLGTDNDFSPGYTIRIFNTGPLGNEDTVPGCLIDTSTGGINAPCRTASGDTGSMKSDEIYAIRLISPDSNFGRVDKLGFKKDGGDHATFDFSVSRYPGQFGDAAICTITQRAEVTFSDMECSVEEGELFYLNVRPSGAGASGCGSGAGYVCKVKTWVNEGMRTGDRKDSSGNVQVTAPQVSLEITQKEDLLAGLGLGDINGPCDPGTGGSGCIGQTPDGRWVSLRDELDGKIQKTVAVPNIEDMQVIILTHSEWYHHDFRHIGGGQYVAETYPPAFYQDPSYDFEYFLGCDDTFESGHTMTSVTLMTGYPRTTCNWGEGSMLNGITYAVRYGQEEDGSMRTVAIDWTQAGMQGFLSPGARIHKNYKFEISHLPADIDASNSTLYEDVRCTRDGGADASFTHVMGDDSYVTQGCPYLGTPHRAEQLEAYGHNVYYFKVKPVGAYGCGGNYVPGVWDTKYNVEASGNLYCRLHIL